MHYRYPFMKNVTHCCIINSHTPTTTVVFTCERTWLSVRLQAPLARWLIRGLHQAKDQKLQIPLQSRDNNLCGHFAVPVITLIGAYFQFTFTVGCLSVFLVPPLWPGLKYLSDYSVDLKSCTGHLGCPIRGQISGEGSFVPLENPAESLQSLQVRH